MEALLTIVLSQGALFDWHRHHADAGHASLTFKTSSYDYADAEFMYCG